MTASRVALLVGGPSRQHNLSRAVATDILEHAAGQLAHLHPVLITPHGQWRLYSSALGYSADTPQSVLEHDEVLTQLPFLFDAAFISLVGEYASDGQLQRMLDRAGMPYQGSGPRATARVWDTAITYQFLRRVGISVPSYLAMNRAEWVVARGRKLRQLMTAMGTSLSIKPNNPHAHELIAVHTPAQLADAIEEMSVRYDRFIVQRNLPGVTVHCAVVETDAGVVPGQLVVRGQQQFAPDAVLALQRMALRVHQALRLRDYCQVDMIVAYGRIWVTAIEVLPALHRVSTFTSSLTALGWSYSDLIGHLTKRALGRPEVIELHP